MGDLIDLGAHSTMTAEQALGRAHRCADDWDSVIILGYDHEDAFSLTSSHMSREQALWLIETAKAYIMQLPMPGSIKDEANG